MNLRQTLTAGSVKHANNIYELYLKILVASKEIQQLRKFVSKVVGAVLFICHTTTAS